MSIVFPNGKRFAFTILDDNDTARVADVRPAYALLEELGMRTTKSVWPLASAEGGKVNGALTLDDPEYREFIVELSQRGFEIASQGASVESSTRERVIDSLDRFREVLGHDPRVHTNNGYNRENLYWGQERVDQPLLKAVVQRAAPTPAGYFMGHVPQSPFWWGDVCESRIDYVRNLTFDDVNLRKVNPSMPYHDPARPYVRWWFSCTDAPDAKEFSQILRPERQEKLEAESGFCIVATHFTNGFVRKGQVDRLARKRLEAMAARDGWFVPVSTLLDHLRSSRENGSFTSDEWARMQWKWARDLVRRHSRQTRREDRISA